MQRKEDGSGEASRLWNGSTSDGPRTPVWLDCDTGHDDAFAILVTALTPRLNLLGISTVYGNAPLDQTTANTLSILTAIKRPDVPVYPGAAHPFCRNPCFAPDIHGATGLDGTTCLPAPTTQARTFPSATQAAYEALLTTPPGTAHVVATGVLTNIALLFATHRDLSSHIAALHIMGGAIGSDFTPAPMGVVDTDQQSGGEKRFGNWTPYAEFNIYCDPEAARSIFMNDVLREKITVVPLDLSHLFLATPKVQQDLLWGYGAMVASDGEPVMVRKLFNEILTFFAQTYADVFGLVEGPPLHDVLPALAVFAPQIFDDRGGERFAVDVVIDGEHGTEGMARTTSQVGRTVVTALRKGENGVRIPRDLDKDTAWRLIDLCLAAVDSRQLM